jgi:hypothetical protein
MFLAVSAISVRGFRVLRITFVLLPIFPKIKRTCPPRRIRIKK